MNQRDHNRLKSFKNNDKNTVLSTNVTCICLKRQNVE